MYSKIKITGTIEVVTGMHIGGSSLFAPIGAVDSPIMRDNLNDYPIIPGSSLKGKIRTLLARQYNKTVITKVEEDTEEIKRLFGSANKDKNKHSRLIFSDALLSNFNDIKDYGVTEIKFENTINRVTSGAIPRQIERVIRGSKFDFQIIYNAEEVNEIKEDIKLLAQGFKMLQYDYLGGHGSRGYGRINIENFDMQVVIG